MEDRDNRRKWPRIPASLRVDFSALGEEQVQGTGVTDNVSRGGMHFRTRDWQLVRAGQSLSVKVYGMGVYDQGHLFGAWSATATVVRLDPPTTQNSLFPKAGVAVRFDERPRVEFADASA